ncbi:hypothetical protein L1049_017996 [Liquidambar formosana]|uniref:Kinesin motor domain-containing protein n=1 Tax=Liquidambar formosana TaxID=63359 RepID=A0AAP0NMT6_LIQFO
MESRKSVRNLVESLHSLLGFKAHFTSSWVNSVCDIIKNLPSEVPPDDCTSTPGNFEKTGSHHIEAGDLGTVISKIEDEIAASSYHINQLNIQRRQVLNDFLDLKGNIRVFCRVRPITLGQNFDHLRPVIALDSSNLLLKLADNKSRSYSFDRVFHPGSSQDEVFSEVEPVIKSVLDGYNACIFAYGQTSTGKTFTMEGTPDCPGVVPRAIEALFKQAVDSNHEFLLSFSMLEIYLGKLRDLLIPQSTKATDPMPPCLSIQTDPKGGIEIDNLAAIQVRDFNQALALYRLGCRFRSTASTNSNTTSSRSHCMIRLTITCFDAPERRRETNKLWTVDLGGSERVLKTKAWGRRLEEGKAINLSLSALGDVINALQRKNRHIPYRNSKLTQVLRDSLGEDSKTLMLVHVSPKEEDLCETICSLNFATRVRTIHLGNGESAEVRDQKEVAMTNLQQKMKQIENEHQDIRRNIKKLNEKLETVTRTRASSDGLEAFHLPIEVPQPKIEATTNRIGDFTAAPLSQLPRFMRPTVCSRRKSGIDHQNLKERDPVPARRRRMPLSHRAESVTFPLKNTSDYNSECSISRTSCLVGLNMKCSADNETDYSEDTSECETKMVVFPEQEKPPRSLFRQKAHLSHGEGYGNRQTYKFSSTKFLKVDNWLHLHKNEPTSISYATKSKRVLAIPTPEKKITCNGQNIAEKLHEKTVQNHECRNKKISHEKIEKLADAGVTGRSIDKTLTLLKDFVNKNCRSSSISPYHTTDAEIMIKRQGSVYSLSTEDNQCGNFSPVELRCDRYDQDNDDNGVNGMSNMKVVPGKMHCPDGFTLNSNSCCHFSPPDIDNSIIDLIEDTGVSISLSELESHCQQVPTDMGMSNSNEKDLHVSSQHSKKGTSLHQYKLRSQRALFMENANKKDLSMPFVKLQGSSQNTGICDILKQKIQILYASTLLGLGIQSCGYNNDFFYGLML